ncbi:MAG: hypothetical protein AAGE76_13050 [Pseudomonadota bacterium]
MHAGQSDLGALYDNASDLDRIMKDLGLPTLNAMIDTTDVGVNMDLTEMPDGMVSTGELMIQQGRWVDFEPARQHCNA